MAEKPANQDLSQQVRALFSISQYETIYEGYMDALLSSLGRDIKIWLPPAQSAPTSNINKFNPWTGSKDPRLGPVSDGPSGRVVEPIYVVYKAHIVHGPRAVSDSVPFDLDIGDVQITTVIGSKEDLERAVEIEVDGIKFDMKKSDIRQIGLQSTKYVISIWKKKAK